MDKKEKSGVGTLTVARNEGEQILIETSDGPISVFIGKIRGHQLRVAIRCDRKIRIDRAEHAQDRIQKYLREGKL